VSPRARGNDALSYAETVSLIERDL
jgi:hypothetical protein